MEIYGTAVEVKTLGSTASRRCTVYRVNPPLVYTAYDAADTDRESTPYVQISMIVEPVEETFMFPCTSSGEVLSFLEMKGSVDYLAYDADIFANIGYQILDEAPISSVVAMSTMATAKRRIVLRK